MKIEDVIKQNKGFSDMFEKAVVNMSYTINWINDITSSSLNQYDLSLQQYNILRILRGQKGKGVTVKFLIERMLDKSSNASRLVDKLLAKGLVEREQSSSDRRRVDIVITQKGLQVLQEAQDNMKVAMDGVRHLSDDEFNQLSDLLDKLRG